MTRLRRPAKSVRVTLERGHLACDTMIKADFPLSAFNDTLQFLLDKVENDMGMFVLRGFPVTRYSTDQMRMIYWGIGLHLAIAVS